ncbi:hypothetical protein [Mucilaginibacter sp.]|uniref:hypothetical protein n=1 Tax=Mucilaginibacter sp. TaxID=1882438 RepID=UPI002629701C|nr:hypothetical protein [Mucilaginibacter sp.]MDB4926784.1 hypothetical protein [Mucilaginibacter sp.]
MKILKSKSGIGHSRLTEYVIDNQIAREDIFTITLDGQGPLEKFTIFYYAEPKPESEKKVFGVKVIFYNCDKLKTYHNYGLSYAAAKL